MAELSAASGMPQVGASPPPPSPSLPPASRTDRLLFGYAAALFVFDVGSFAAFSVVYTDVRAAIDVLLIVHAALMTAWFAIFAFQAWLVVAGRRHAHRNLGRANLLFVPPIFALGAYITWRAAVADDNPIVILENVIVSSLGFIPLYALALRAARRRDLDRHKRYMAVAMLTLSAPAFGRFMILTDVPPPAFMGLYALLGLVLPIALDLATRRRPHRASLEAGGWHLAMVALLLGSMLSPLPDWISRTYLVG